MPIHSTMTGADLHEPKGIESASLNTAYVADGLGSGQWIDIKENFAIAVLFPLIDVAKSYFVPATKTSVLKRISVSINAGINLDTTITVLKNGVPILNGAVVITASGSAAGNVFSTIVNEPVSLGDSLQLQCDGGSTQNSDAVVVLHFEAGGI